MKHFKEKERQETISNGYAYDMAHEAEAKVKEMSNTALANPELKGLAILSGGILLLAHTLGYFTVLNWALMAASLGAIFYGANKANAWERIKQASAYIKDWVSSKK